MKFLFLQPVLFLNSIRQFLDCLILSKVNCISVCIFFSLLSNQSLAQTHRCVTMERHRHLVATHPEYAASDPLNAQGRISSAYNDTDFITIPVVVHVLYNQPEQNITNEQIQSQIDVLNEDFSLMNPSSVDIPSTWLSLATDTRIRFALARQDPSGNRTDGITRTATLKTVFTERDDDIFESDSGGYDPWPSSSYLNIWIGPLKNNVLGFANFPSSAGSIQDGVVLNYKAVGRRGTVAYPYDGGRTGTHEVGHWLALLHIWGDDGGLCTGRDFTGADVLLDDTPNQADANYRCRSFPLTDACSPASPGIMFMNYMDYTDDACMSFFTKGQSKKMRAVLFNQRDAIRFSTGHLLPLAQGNDAAIDSVLAPLLITGKRCLKPRIRLINQGQAPINRMTIEYGIAGGLRKQYIWEGSLNPLESVVVNLPLIGSGIGRQVMEFSILESDDYTANNFRSAGFVVTGSTEENCISADMTAFPNPLVEGTLACVKTRFDNPQDDATIMVCNALGQLIRSENRSINPGDSFLVDLQGLPSGVYMVGVVSDEVSGAARVIYMPGTATSSGAVPVCN